jgi:hypothetical protein
VLNTALGGAAGVMLAATSFSLIVPGIESAVAWIWRLCCGIRIPAWRFLS